MGDKVKDKVDGGEIRIRIRIRITIGRYPPPIGKRSVSSVTLTIFIGVLAERTVSGSVSGSVPEEGTSVSTGEFFTKGNEGNQDPRPVFSSGHVRDHRIAAIQVTKDYQRLPKVTKFPKGSGT